MPFAPRFPSRPRVRAGEKDCDQRSDEMSRADRIQRSRLTANANGSNAAAATRVAAAMPSIGGEYHVADFCAVFDSKMSSHHFG
jgi:hypothetical protein